MRDRTAGLEHQPNTAIHQLVGTSSVVTSPEGLLFLEDRSSSDREPPSNPAWLRARRGGAPSLLENSLLPVRVRSLTHTDALRPAPGRTRCPTQLTWTAQERTQRPQQLPPAGSPHQTSRRRPGSQPRWRTEVSPGARAHTIPVRLNRAHGPPARTPAAQPCQPRTTRLTCGPQKDSSTPSRVWGGESREALTIDSPDHSRPE